VRAAEPTDITEAVSPAKPSPAPKPPVRRVRPAPAPRPGGPRPKSRDSGVVKPVDYQAAEAAVAEPEPDSEGERKPRRPRNRFLAAGVLFVVALVFIGLAVWFKIEDTQLTAATSNTALLDVARTAQVNQAATNAVETLFSYDYTNIAKTQDAAKNLLLNDDVRNKYNALMGEVVRLAPQQKMVVTVKASRSAVVMLDGDLAKVMVFVDQTATRTDQNQTSSGPAQLWVQMQYSGGQWKVADLDTYQAPQPAPTSAPPASSTVPPPPSSTPGQ
jgi:Mce-associated membrane protein